jgi:hypothetical protein
LPLLYYFIITQLFSVHHREEAEPFTFSASAVLREKVKQVEACDAEPVRRSFANRSERSEEAHGELRGGPPHFFSTNTGMLRFSQHDSVRFTNLRNAALPADVNHRARRLNEIRFVDAVAGLFMVNEALNIIFNLGVTCAAPHHSSHVMLGK